jgi:hypothetical protein
LKPKRDYDEVMIKISLRPKRDQKTKQRERRGKAFLKYCRA